MNKADTEVLKFSINKYWKEKTDAELAASLDIPESEVREMRLLMGLQHPKSGESLKDFAKRYILDMSEPEKRAFIASLPPDLVWKMAEGNAPTTTDTGVKRAPPVPIMSLDVSSNEAPAPHAA